MLAREGVSRSWATKADLRSPRYTTRISELPIVIRKSQAFKGAAVLWLGGLDGGLKEKKLGRSDWVRFQRMSYRISFYNS